MDVSSWTVNQRMRLPDWCFGNRQVISAYAYNAVRFAFEYEISTLALPDPACIWQIVIVSQPSTDGTGHIRIGLANTVPANEAEMDLATEILPDYGVAHTGPNQIHLYSTKFTMVTINLRKGMATDGKKLVIENYCNEISMRVECNLVVSGLPTSMAGWLAHHRV